MKDMLANPLCVSVEDLSKAMCNEEKLANPLCVSVEDLSKAMCMKKSLQTLYV